MMRKKSMVILFILGLLFIMKGNLLSGEEIGSQMVLQQEKRVREWRKERDDFFKTHDRSPLTPKGKKEFNGLKYYPFNPQFIFPGEIERYLFHINNPQYYAIFLTNKGIKKRYIRYGKLHFKMDGEPYLLEIFKSILSDNLFIPFKDRTNEKETYEGGRYIDAEILPGYKMVLDFNMAYLPLCAYNNKLICVIPPKENRLNIAVQAGERNFKPF